MAWIQWNENKPDAVMAVVQSSLQRHEDLLMGNEQDGTEGIVPRFNTFMTQIDFSKKLGLVLNAVIILGLAIMSWRIESKAPQVIYLPAPASPSPAPPPTPGQTQRKTFAEPPAMGVISSQQNAGGTEMPPH